MLHVDIHNYRPQAKSQLLTSSAQQLAALLQGAVQDPPPEMTTWKGFLASDVPCLRVSHSISAVNKIMREIMSKINYAVDQKGGKTSQEKDLSKSSNILHSVFVKI